jgi:hypothetical protein
MKKMNKREKLELAYKAVTRLLSLEYNPLLVEEIQAIIDSLHLVREEDLDC